MSFLRHTMGFPNADNYPLQGAGPPHPKRSKKIRAMSCFGYTMGLVKKWVQNCKIGPKSAKKIAEVPKNPEKVGKNREDSTVVQSKHAKEHK